MGDSSLESQVELTDEKCSEHAVLSVKISKFQF